jgi:diaminohydroxyphosphoribosylaminopyrimidine deaminase/5-amino-6-(5-phosphoribosylamino)uracil reductase
VDAVLVGANTVRLDNPRLTARLARKRGRNPVRVVLDSGLRLSERLRVFTSAPNPRTVVATLEPADARKASRLSKRGVEVWTLHPAAGGVDLRGLLRRLAAGGLFHVLAEGGAGLHRSLLSQGLADEIMLFVAPMIVGADGLSWVGSLGVRELRDAVRTTPLICEQSGEDLLIQTRPVASRRTRR